MNGSFVGLEPLPFRCFGYDDWRLWNLEFWGRGPILLEVELLDLKPTILGGLGFEIDPLVTLLLPADFTLPVLCLLGLPNELNMRSVDFSELQR